MKIFYAKSPRLGQEKIIIESLLTARYLSKISRLKLRYCTVLWTVTSSIVRFGPGWIAAFLRRTDFILGKVSDYLAGSTNLPTRCNNNYYLVQLFRVNLDQVFII